MAHKLPTPLRPRVFSVLLLTVRCSNDCLVVQVPVDLKGFSGAFYSNGRNQTEGASPLMKKEVLLARYTSIERVRKDGRSVEWTMATTSDAGGNLPMWVQNMGTPGAVVKDVGLFMKWIAEKRSG